MKYIIISILLFDMYAFSKTEVWGYLYENEESFFPDKSIITDIAHYRAQIITDGELNNPISTPPYVANASDNIRRHLVITGTHGGKELFHYYLHSELPIKTNIINNIVLASDSYDGIQINFEGIGEQDGIAFLNFLIDLKSSLPDEKIFSVAVMARWDSHKKKNPMDAYDYRFIGKIADRVIIMAYDEHWSSGSPGPIASLPWCEKIFRHALKNIPKEKIIMGIPLYGRAWMPKKVPILSKHKEINKKLNQLKIKSNETISGGSFSFKEDRIIHVHHETIESLKKKQLLYLSYPIGGTAYWRIGQEPDGFWESFKN